MHTWPEAKNWALVAMSRPWPCDNMNRDKTTAPAQGAQTAQGHTWHYWRVTKSPGRQTAQPGRTKPQAQKTLENMPKSEYLENR